MMAHDGHVQLCLVQETSMAVKGTKAIVGRPSTANWRK
ncbi:hypothetical protein GFC30_2129 [Anoxybacillus amylolyticus]|uniref:Uncharacterized protein n=1 Tax=Anoxybacteroides amylolyticum TaxID=294699 RepID=A0A167T0Z9_9BACL|nr:hypothetical protein GFC30_2129 [Anoxybacillus amylolyticus]